MSCPRGCCATYREHLSSLTIAAGPSAQTRKEAALGRDLDAMQRLVAAGHEPRTITGAAELERTAQSKVEIERGHLIRNDRLRQEVEQASTVGSP